MPLSWFVSRESPGAKSAFVESFGFIASDEPRELNPNRLPDGFTASPGGSATARA